MFVASVDPSWSLEAWRTVARAALQAGIAPQDVQWDAGDQEGLALGVPVIGQPQVMSGSRVPASFIGVAGSVLCHSTPGPHALLYRLLWRINNGEPKLLERATDPDVVAATAWSQSVRRDSHKMKAFVRFRRLTGADESYVAWFEPEHFIVDRVAPFFARRFAGMHWAILTPYRSVRWTGESLIYGAGASRAQAPTQDAQEDLWRTYYANIFNPARLNPTMMRQEMPQKYWKGLPETHLLPDLLRGAGRRVQEMAERPAQAPRRRIPAAVVPRVDVVEGSLADLRVAASQCRQCELWKPATQVVCGEGPDNARVMIIGEQPGDEEDLTGRPFVGPSGKLLDRALSELGLDRGALYVTNAVKHFRFTQRGKKRLHQNPEQSHVSACRGWLDQELATVRPEIIVCLGATAARALLGNQFRLLAQRGQWQTLGGGVRAFATVHPSWILRQPDTQTKADAYAGFARDLALLLEARED